MSFLLLALTLLPLVAEAKTPPLVLSFDGKGTAMAWDIGVVRALDERLNRNAVGETYFVGSSSGSILAAYFACEGFNYGAIARLWQTGTTFPKDVLDEETDKKAMQLFLGLTAEASLAPLNPIIDLVTRQDTCVPRFPLLIATANLDVVNGRRDKPFAGEPGRTFDQGTYELSQNGAVRGKVCTYFANEPMVKILGALPAKERLCDVRLIKSGADLRMAVVASISEPTYYVPVGEPDLHLIESVYPTPSARSYGGGFVMNSVIQDVKRSMPEAWTIGTGRPIYTRLQNRIIKNWFAFPMNDTLLDQRWWFDAQAPLSIEMWDRLYEKKVTTTNQMAWGYWAMHDCLEAGSCLPEVFTTPKFSRDAAGKNIDELRHRKISTILK